MGRRKRKPFPELHIHGIADRGKSVGRTAEGEVVFVEGAVPGDTVHALGLRKKKGVWQANVEEILQASPHRIKPICAHFEDCGGCKWQHFDYAGQLQHKEQTVKDAILRIGKLPDTEVRPILGSEAIFHYRNKMEYSFSKFRWLTEEEIQSDDENLDREHALGLHRPGSFDKIVDLEFCHLQAEPGNAIRNMVKTLAVQEGWTFYDPRAQKGWLRALVLRNNEKGAFMLCLVASERKEEEIQWLFDQLSGRFPEITSFYFMLNQKKNDSLADLKAELWQGDEYLQISIGDCQYELGPKSFFQTNTRQAKTLYDQVIQMAELKGEETVYDLYTGIGSIALYLAGACKKVVGIEEIPEAVEDAKRNAARNDHQDLTFYAGDVRAVLDPAFAERHGAPDIVVTDPPRAGMHEDVVRFLLELKAPKIVYVSCNPATQARDLKLLSEAYDVPAVQPVDMFPHTHHIESVAILKLRS